MLVIAKVYPNPGYLAAIVDTLISELNFGLPRDSWTCELCSGHFVTNPIR